MRHCIGLIVLSLCTITLSGCTAMAVGPDLDKTPSPFGDVSNIRLSTIDDPRYYLKIQHSADGDKGIYRDPTQGNLTYKADITYYGFSPLLAETNAARRDYWLVGINLTQTKDRSFYFLLRYPYGKPLRSGEAHTDFEIAAIGCAAMQNGVSRDLNFAGSKPKTPATEEYDWSTGTFPAEAKAPTPEPPAPIVLPDDPSDRGCEFKDMDEVRAFAPKVLLADEKQRRDNLSKPEDERRTDLGWVSIKAEPLSAQ
jgi:hypothetical protein